ncbi:MAG: Ig-like domain-containing protein [Thainema sp.]
MDRLRFEAESLILSGYSVETNGDIAEFASNDSIVKLTGESGTVSKVISAAEVGTYDIEVAYFDEKDGQSTARILLNGVELPGSAWVFDSTSGSTRASANNRYVFRLEGVTLAEGDVLTIEGTQDAGENARLDYIDLVVNDTTNPSEEPPTPPEDTNTAPDAIADSYMVDAGNTLAVSTANGVIANDVDGNGDALSVVLNQGVSHGTLTLSSNGSFTYTPENGFSGTDSFIYTLTDGNGGTDTGTVTLTVNPVLPSEDPPSEDPVPTGDPLRIEAEDMTLGGSYGVEAKNFASAGEYIGLSGPSGTASATFTGATGTYKVVVGYYDENDGKSPLTVKVGGQTLDSWVFDQSLGGTRAEERNFVERIVAAEVTVTNGSLIELIGYQESGENARVDYIEFIPVGPANAAPNAQSDSYSTAEETALVINAATGVLSNDSDPEGDAFSISAYDTTSASGGSVVMNANGSFTYTPAANFNGTDSFTYTISDENGGTATETVTIAVSAANDVPVAADDTLNTGSNTPLTFSAADLFSNDSDIDGDALALESFTNPANGTVINNGDGTFTYTPSSGFSGVDSFTYTVNDGNGGTATATVNIAVNFVNTPPVAGNDAIATDEDTPLAISPATLLGNDMDADGQTLTISNLTQPSHGSLTNNGNGTYTYTPNANFSGTDSFTYTIDDGNGDTDTATVTVTVTAVNDQPAATDDTFSTVAETELVLSTAELLGNDSDIDGDSLSISVGNPSNGTLTNNGNGTYSYTPNSGFTGTDSFTYTVNDGNGGVDTAIVTVTVDPQPPVSLDPIRLEAEDMALSSSYGVEAKSFASAGEYIGLTGATGTASTAFTGATGTYKVIVGYYDESDGEATLTVNIGGSSIDSWAFDNSPGGTRAEAKNFTLRTVATELTVNTGDLIELVGLQDPQGENARVDYIEFIPVGPANEQPLAQPDSYSTAEDTELVINAATGVLSNDSDPENSPLSVSAYDTTSASGGTVVMNANGSFTYTPAANFSGTDSFTYTVSDENEGTSTEIVTITVTAVDDDPTATNDVFVTNPNTSLSVSIADLLSNDSDADGDPLTLISVTDPANGVLNDNGDGTYTYIPTGDFTGTDSFTYTVSDGSGGTDTATVSIVVSDPSSGGLRDYSLASNGIIANLRTQTVLQPVYGNLAAPKLMPMGDSITEGDHSIDPVPGSYRTQFWQRAIADGLITDDPTLRIDFVGSAFDSDAPDALGDKDHEGHRGWTINNMRDRRLSGSDSVIDNYDPDVVMVMLGTNDVLQGSNADSVLSRLSSLIDDASRNDNIVLVSSLTPLDASTDKTNASEVAVANEVNSRLPGLVADKVAAGMNVFFVNAGGGLTLADINDGVHPTASGYDRLGDLWYEEVMNPESFSDVTQLIGSTYDDRITSGFDSDVLTGNGGADRFVYLNPNDGPDTITDFSVDDWIVVSATGFDGGLVSGMNLDNSRFIRSSNPVATTNMGTFLFNTSTHTLSFDEDGMGSDVARTLATFTNGYDNLQANQIEIMA